MDGTPITNDHLATAEVVPTTEQLIDGPTEQGVSVDSTFELAAHSTLKVDVEEFHPRFPNYPTLAQAARTSQQRQNRNQSNNTSGNTNLASHFNGNHVDQYPRRRGDDEFRRRRMPENHYNRSRRTFNGTSTTAPTVPRDNSEPIETKKKEKEPTTERVEVPQAPIPSAQKTPPKSTSKSNSKRAIQASIKNIEQSNIDLSKTKITAAQTSANAADTNQWLVKTKGKKSRAVRTLDIPGDDMFDNEEEIYEELPVEQEEKSEEPEPVVRASTPIPVEKEEEVREEPAEERTPPKTSTTKQKKSPNAKAKSKSASKKSKTPAAKGATSTGSKGFEVIEPDFGVITRLKTEPISFESELQEELENILNMKDIDVEELKKCSPILPIEEDPIFRSSSLPKSPRNEKDNVIDLDDLEALERSLMDFDLSGELKERMIEIIQSEMEIPLGGAGNGNKEFEEYVVEEIKIEASIAKPIKEEPKFEKLEETNQPELFQESQVEAEIVVEAPVEPEEPSPIVIVAPSLGQDVIEDTVIAVIEVPEIPQTNDTEENATIEDHLNEQETELKIITSGMSMDEASTGSSSSSSSLSSPIPTDDGRDGSNSESDDVMTPPAILPEDQDKKRVLPSDLESRLQFPREPVCQQKSEQPLEAIGATGIAASVSKWLDEKNKECSPEPILRIPSDPEVAKLIFKAMYGVDLALDENDEDDDEMETEDDMDSLSADESDFEPDSRDSLKDLLGISREKRDNQVPIDTDSDYMSDGQNIKPGDLGKVPNAKPASTAAEMKSSSAAALSDAGRGQRGAKMCKVM